MHKGTLSRESVLRAIEECDEAGADAFRETYGFGRARVYVLHHEGRTYDSKAIAGVAHRHEYGRALTSEEFSGGKAAAVAWLERVGFVVERIR
ncbi:hypothetical protein ACFRMQ_27020 [Kitasatospora sp. NPDC056783]|uniref:hypothetical protein n=1 Tax=Kitasatospora sp. NPDC056783 TaxID=3345943 RepID=UPI0036AD81FA